MREIRPFVLVGLIPVLVVLAAGGAYVLYPSLVSPSRQAHLPTTRDALLAVPVLVGDGGDLRILLRPHYQRPEADRADDALLSAYLFPGRDVARFVVLWVFNYGSREAVVFDREASSFELRDRAGRRVRPLDLPGAVAHADLRPDLLLGLKMHEAHSRRVSVPPGAYRRVLLALPGGTALADIAEAHVLGVHLTRHDVVRCRLEDYLARPGDREALLAEEP